MPRRRRALSLHLRASLEDAFSRRELLRHPLAPDAEPGIVYSKRN